MIGVVLEVVVARPKQLDWSADCLRNLYSFLHEIRAGTPSKATAHECHVDDDGVVGQARDCLGGLPGRLGCLGRHPYLAPVWVTSGVGSDVCSAIHWLHRSVREERDIVSSPKGPGVAC